jgi:hypothetical protein
MRSSRSRELLARYLLAMTNDQGKMRPHHLFSRSLDVALGLAHLRRSYVELLDREAHTQGKGGKLPPERLVPLFDPTKLSMRILQHADEFSDSIRVQFKAAVFPSGGR